MQRDLDDAGRRLDQGDSDAQQDDGVTGQAKRLKAAARRRMGRATAMAGRRHSRSTAQ